MRELVIGDVHFGVKTNSTFWLETQLDFFRKQIFNVIKEEKLDRIVFLGDLFDIRYSVQQEVGIEVKQIIRELANLFEGDIIFIAGNHDYYSPLEEFAYYNSYELVFGEEFIKCHPNIRIVSKEPYLSPDGGLFLPWYWTDNDEHFSELLYRYNFRTDVNAIYCHADLNVWPGPRIASIKGKPIFAGHIHNLYFDRESNLYNLGAALPLTFSDVNERRYVYILEDYKISKRITNETTPMFIRIYNEDIFSPDSKVFENSYIQLCVSNSNINKAQYIEQIKNLKATYTNANIKLHLIDDNDSESTINTYTGFNTNIKQYIENNIPDYLTDKYELIKTKIENIE